MSDGDATRWCPVCRQPTTCAPLPQMAGDLLLLEPLGAADEPQAFRRKLYCTDCKSIWESYELPGEFIGELLGDRQALEDARRQLAMLRVLLAEQRGGAEEAPRPAVVLRAAG